MLLVTRALIFSLRTKMDVQTCDYVANANMKFVPYFSSRMAYITLRYAAENLAAVRQLEPLRSV